MDHHEFRIGLEFFTATGRWRCTDVGSRVVVAISLEPHDVVLHRRQAQAGGATAQETVRTSDPSWFNGPPYAVVETVFDEYDLLGCSLEPKTTGS